LKIPLKTLRSTFEAAEAISYRGGSLLA